MVIKVGYQIKIGMLLWLYLIALVVRSAVLLFWDIGFCFGFLIYGSFYFLDLFFFGSLIILLLLHLIVVLAVIFISLDFFNWCSLTSNIINNILFFFVNARTCIMMLVINFFDKCSMANDCPSVIVNPDHIPIILRLIEI